MWVGVRCSTRAARPGSGRLESQWMSLAWSCKYLFCGRAFCFFTWSVQSVRDRNGVVLRMGDMSRSFGGRHLNNLALLDLTHGRLALCGVAELGPVVEHVLNVVSLLHLVLGQQKIKVVQLDLEVGHASRSAGNTSYEARGTAGVNMWV